MTQWWKSAKLFPGIRNAQIKTMENKPNNLGANIDLILNKIKVYKAELKDKLLKRGEAIRDGGGYHENAAAEALDQEIHFLESRIQELNKNLDRFYKK